MESNGKFIFTLILIMIIIIALAGYYFIGMNDNVSLNSVWNTVNNVIRPGGNNTVNNNQVSNNQVGNNEIVAPITFSTVKDYQIYFNVNNLINKFYDNLIINNAKEVIGVLDEKYVSNNGINGTNISSFFKTNYHSMTYYSKMMYVKSNDQIAYYFVSGEEQLYDMVDERLYEVENVFYLVTIDKVNDAYSIMPIKTTSFFDYAKNYEPSGKKKVTSNAYNTYFSDNYNDERITNYYLNYFKTILFLNSEKAYNMLESDYKATFEDYEDFNKHLTEIYDKLNSKLMRFAVKGEDGKRVYSAVGENQSRYDMTETSIMNFKITIK